MPILSREAEQDVCSAYEWYESQRENLGRAFVLEVDRALEAAQERPEAYMQCYKSVRRDCAAVSVRVLLRQQKLGYFGAGGTPSTSQTSIMAANTVKINGGK